MAKRQRSRNKNRNKHKSRRMRGGSYTSASTYGNYVNGSAGAQFGRTFDQSGPYGQVSGNVLIGAQGQNVISSAHMPNGSQLSLIQNGGRRRRRRGGGKSRRGGNIGQVFEQAIVPLGLVAMQHVYRKGKGTGTGHRRTKRRRRH